MAGIPPELFVLFLLGAAAYVLVEQVVRGAKWLWHALAPVGLWLFGWMK